MKSEILGIFGCLAVGMALAAPAAKTRTFSIQTVQQQVNPRGGMALATEAAAHSQTVYFEGATNTLVVCDFGQATKCQRSTLAASDVVPYQRGILIVDTPRSYRLCAVHAVGYTCKPLTMADLGVQLSTASKFLKAGEYSGTYTAAHGLLFASAQAFKSGGLLFGNFTGKGLQALDVASSVVCDIGASCRQAQGIETARAAATIASAQAVDPKVDRAHVLGVDAHSRVACVAYHDSPTVVGFNCQQEMTEPHAGAEIFVTQNRDGFNNFVEAQSPQASVMFRPAAGAATVNVSSFKALALRATTTAGLPLKTSFTASEQPGMVTAMASGGRSKYPPASSYGWSGGVTWSGSNSSGDVVWTDTEWSDQMDVEYDDGYMGLAIPFATNLPGESWAGCVSRVTAMLFARTSVCNAQSPGIANKAIAVTAIFTFAGGAVGKLPGALAGFGVGAGVASLWSNQMNADCVGQANSDYQMQLVDCE